MKGGADQHIVVRTLVIKLSGQDTVRSVGSLLICVGAKRTIVGAHLSIVGARAPTEVCKLTPMLGFRRGTVSVPNITAEGPALLKFHQQTSLQLSERCK